MPATQATPSRQAAPDGIAIACRDVCKTFKRDTGEIVRALDKVSIEAAPGTITALVGPDGAGKTTLIRLIAGLMAPDSGSIRAAGVDVVARPHAVQSRVGYMPQKFGLYEDLTVQENLDLYADLHGVTVRARQERYPRLMEMTQLGRFTHRLAGRLSGGMKQKLGLACTLVRLPELLLLDEPTVGVDPLSRRELWAIIRQLVSDGLPVLLSTAYLDEAEYCQQAVLLHEGRLIGRGSPGDVSAEAQGRTWRVRPASGLKPRQLQARLMNDPGIVDAVPEGGRVRFVTSQAEGRPQEIPGGETPEPASARFEDGFMVLLHRALPQRPASRVELSENAAAAGNGEEVVVEVRDLVRRFGSFTAVDHITFQVRRGEIFGLLGPNGAGKSTTFRMLCGLLPASGGTLQVAGMDLRHARASARQRVGYVSQKFALYGHLTVMENLRFYSSVYGLRGRRRAQRIAGVLDEFELRPHVGLPATQLPGGYKQRLAMAAALMHEPEILFLDEPTSGVDPLARREFWQRITAVAERGVTVIVTTHFMEEAEYCDRMVIMVAGNLLAEGTPAEIRRHARGQSGREPTIEDAFIAVVEEFRREQERKEGSGA